MYYNFWSKSLWLKKVFYSILWFESVHLSIYSVYRPFFHLVIPSVESVHLSVHPSNCSVHLSIHSVRPSVYSFHLSLHLSSQSIHSVHPTMLSARIFMSVYLSISLSIRSVPIHLSVCPSGNITVCPICLLVPPSVHLSICPSIHTIHPFSLSGRPSVQSVHLSIQTLLISSSVISRGISIQPTEMTGPVKVS